MPLRLPRAGFPIGDGPPAMTAATANGQLDAGAHTATLTALGRLMHTLTADDTW